MDWLTFWDAKASAGNDFQATGRGLMDVPGYLNTVAEIVRILDLHQGDHLADIGCGAGLIAMTLAPWLKRVYAVDLSPALIERASKNLAGVNNVDLKVGNLTELPLTDALVDKLLAYSVLQYLADESNVSQAMHEVARVLKPGGRALLAANPDPTQRLVYEAVVRQRADQAAAAREISLLDDLLWLPEAQLLELAAAAGLKARIEPIDARIWQHFYMFDLVLEKSK